jgi:tRNA(Met) C34 N-acetyltransferase TmcA
MKRNSIEIEELLFNKQIELYIRIDNLINKQFDELEADVMSVLTRTLMDLEDRIQLYKKELEKREMYGNSYKERNNFNQ